MNGKIIKLDEYLEKHRWNIVRAVADALGMDPNDKDVLKKVDELMVEVAKTKFNNDIHELQTNLVAALDAHDAEAVQQIMAQPEEFDETTFNGYDIAEGYNFHCKIENQLAKDNYMDWLEENNLDYLIDNDGRFAVKCPTRKVEYKASKAADHMMSKWDRGSIGKNVDPTVHKPGLTDIKRYGLNDNLDEIAASNPVYTPGTGKGVETGIGPSMFPADKKKKTKHFSDEELKDMVKEHHLMESKKAKKKSAKRREKEAKDKLADLPPPGAGGAEKMMKDFGPKGTDPERIDTEQKHKEKKKKRKKIDLAKLDEAVLGMIGMPTISRIRQLAGLPEITDEASKNVVETTIDEMPSGGFDIALSKFNEVYSSLDENQKEQFKNHFMNKIMKDD